MAGYRRKRVNGVRQHFRKVPVLVAITGNVYVWQCLGQGFVGYGPTWQEAYADWQKEKAV